MTRAKSLGVVAVLFACLVSCGAAFGLAGHGGNYTFTKIADKVAVIWGDEVTYTYTVTNENSQILYDVTVVDDAGTPDDPSDDFTAGQVDELGRGKSVTFTHTMPLTPMIGDEEQARVSLIAGQNYDAGDVIVYLEDGQLRVVVETKDGWKLTETHLYLSVGSECDPPSKSSPGRFPYSHEQLGGVTTDEFVIDVPDIEPGDVVTVALHAVVRNDNLGGPSGQEETAWGEGEPLKGGWSMYFCFEVDPPRPGDLCVTNTAVVTAKAFDSNGILRPYWSDSDTATVCVFLSRELYDISGKVYVDLSAINIPVQSGAGGIPVELRKLDGTLIATVQTRRDGTYSFIGVPTGDYFVLVPLSVELRANSWVYALTEPGVGVSVVDQNVTDVDFGFSLINTKQTYDIVYIQDTATPKNPEPAREAPEDDASDEKPGNRKGPKKNR